MLYMVSIVVQKKNGASVDPSSQELLYAEN